MLLMESVSIWNLPRPEGSDVVRLLHPALQSLGQPGEEQEEQKREARERECPVPSPGSRCLRERWPEQDEGREGWSFCYNIGLLIHELKLPDSKKETLRKARGPAEMSSRNTIE